MSHQKKIATGNFDYDLPEERIPKYPMSERERSNLLVYRQGEIGKDVFENISRHIPPGYLMVYNNARVVYARLQFTKETGAAIEIFCLEPLSPADYAQAFQQTQAVTWKCLVGNLKKWKGQALRHILQVEGRQVELKARLVSREEDHVTVEFTWDQPAVNFGQILDLMGKVPIPPYLKRESEPVDKQRYQTVYSKVKGSVAAPTAGLHFTGRVLEELREKGVEDTEITLHVGAGTFQPVKAETIDQHTMHMEHFEVSVPTLDRLIARYPKILPVGTTSLRTLESLYWIGVKLEGSSGSDKVVMLDQWEHTTLDKDMPVSQALENIKDYLNRSGRQYLQASTRIMIAPGYPFKMTRGLITNFHQPKSTLLMLIAAFVGDDWKSIYDYALNNEFRFLSYGDSSLLLPHEGSSSE